MKRVSTALAITIASLTLSLLAFAGIADPTHAQIGGEYDLTWNTLDAGGSMYSTGGTGRDSYELAGTIGQPDAGLASGNSYVLSGGFWPSPLYRAFTPIVTRS